MLLFYKIVFERRRLKVKVERLTMLHDARDSTEPGLRVNMKIRNRGPGSTSIESVHFVTILLTLRNLKLTDRPTLVSEKVGETVKEEILKPTNLPVRIGGGTTRRYEVEFAPSISVRSLNIFGSKWMPRRLRRLQKRFAKEHNLVVETTHKTFRVKLGWSALVERDKAILRETHPLLFADEPP
jgi:hypothetical protein